jgi:broad specificity phosphatase PhoE
MLGIPITVVTVDRARIVEHPAELWRRIVAEHRGETVLVVGHSNTIPAIIGALGGPAMPELCDAEYANLFVLSMPARGRPRLVRASYGAPDAAGASGCNRGMSQ